METKKRISIVGLIISLLLFVAGISITLAVYTYTRSGTVNSKQIVGDIYMHYNESNSITLENAMPRNSYIPNSYFEFTIDGKNTTTNKDIYYDIILSHGDVPQGKTGENRIADKFLKFRLVEVINSEETEIFNNKSYHSLNNKRIYVETIPKNTQNEVVHIYRLYCWIGNEVLIGNTDDANYSEIEWNNLFSSIKVNVTGDFSEKIVTTDDECFIAIPRYIVNPNMTDEEKNKCVQYLKTLDWDYDQSLYPDFCQGIVDLNSESFQSKLDMYNYFNLDDFNYLKNNNIIVFGESATVYLYDDECEPDVVIPNELETVDYSYNSSMTTEEKNKCIQFINSLNWTWDEGETVEAFCNGTGTYWGDTFSDSLYYNYFSYDDMIYLSENNIITTVKFNNKYLVKTIGPYAFSYNQLASITMPNSVTTIGTSAFAYNQLTSVIIPNSVTTIGPNAFTRNQLSSVEIPNSVISIGYSAFSENQLTSLVLPDSVETIGAYAFYNNKLINVTIGSGIIEGGIYTGAFYKKSNSNPNLASININRSCNDIKNVLGKIGTYNLYPWLSDISPYTGIGGVTIYGANNQVCDTF